MPERWWCPDCGTEGQVQPGHESETSLARHRAVVHPDDGRIPIHINPEPGDSGA